MRTVWSTPGAVGEGAAAGDAAADEEGGGADEAATTPDGLLLPPQPARKSADRDPTSASREVASVGDMAIRSWGAARRRGGQAGLRRRGQRTASARAAPAVVLDALCSATPTPTA